MCVCVFPSHFAGPECLPLISTATVNTWFVRGRGRAAAVLGTMRVFFYTEPVVMGLLIERLGWRRTYVACRSLPSTIRGSVALHRPAVERGMAQMAPHVRWVSLVPI